VVAPRRAGPTAVRVPEAPPGHRVARSALISSISNLAAGRRGFEVDDYGWLLPDDPEEYRQNRAVETWHFCSNCSNWPGWNDRVSYEKPSSGRLCNECLAKRSDGTCSN